MKSDRRVRRDPPILANRWSGPWLSLLVVTGLMAAGPVPRATAAQLIDVDFNLNSSATEGGPNPGPTMSGAAVLGSAGDHWNGLDAGNGTAAPLIYANGTASPVTMTFTSAGGYNVQDYGGSTPFATTPYNALMEDYLYNGGTPQTVVLSGLTANTTYNLIVYNAADENGAGRTTYFTVNGATLASTWNGTNNTLAAGVDYVNFPAALSDGNGNLTITWTGNGTSEGDLNGFQIEPAPFNINATFTSSNLVLSFMTQAGFGYQAEYKNALSDPDWIPVGNFLPGNNAMQSVADLALQTSRFYRVLLSTNATTGLSLLQASGTNIVNASGRVVQLKGLNLGSWLLMEKWMCPLDSGSMPDNYSVLTNLDSRFGVIAERDLIHTYQTNWITTSDLDNITNAGFNCVRCPVWWGNFFSMTNTTSSGWRSDAFAELDWLVTNCTARGIYVVIDLHGVIGQQGTSQDTGEQNVNEYWTNSVDQSQTAWMWLQIASHYNGNGTVAGYDLINEPDGAPSTAAVWNAYDSLYGVIRSVDPQHMIIMEGTFGNWNWSMLPNPSAHAWTNVAYSMHEYQYGGTVAQIETGSDNQVADFTNHLSWNVPDYIGEWNDMGQGAACYEYSINDYNNAGISWTMWAYKATHGLVPDGWGWYDPTYWPYTPNISTDSSATISADWQQWRTSEAFGVNAAVGL